MLTITINDTITPELERIADRAHDLSPVMTTVKNQIFAPAISPAWALSGLHAATGELRQAVTAWSGKLSAGVTLRSKPGRDLILPKAATHTKGRAKRAKTKKKVLTIKAHSRLGRSIDGYKRRNPGSPWGDIPARPFFPEETILTTATDRIKTMIIEHLHAGTR